MIINQVYLFLIFIINGVIIGILFDFFRILRKSFKTSDIITYFEDFLFWILTGFSILYFVFVFNNGEIRLFMFLGIVVGITLYMLIFSSLFIKINVSVITFLKRIFIKVLEIILIPFRFFKKLFFKPVSFIIINVRKSSTNLYNNFIKITKKHKKIENNVKN